MPHYHSHNHSYSMTYTEHLPTTFGPEISWEQHQYNLRIFYTSVLATQQSRTFSSIYRNPSLSTALDCTNNCCCPRYGSNSQHSCTGTIANVFPGCRAMICVVHNKTDSLERNIEEDRMVHRHIDCLQTWPYAPPESCFTYLVASISPSKR